MPNRHIAETPLPTWPAAQLHEALDALARAAGMPPRDAALPPPPPEVCAPGALPALSAWLESAAGWLGLEIEPVSVSYPEVEDLLLRAGPALVASRDDAPGFVALLRGGRRAVTVLGPDLRRHRVPAAAVRALMCGDFEARAERGLEPVLAHVEPSRRARVRDTLVRQRLGPVVVEGGWLLRLPPGASFARQLWAAGVGRAALGLMATHAVQFAIYLLSWYTIGRGVLQGHLDTGFIAAWLLLLLTTVPLRMLATWCQGLLGIYGGGALKRRLLFGALRLDPDATRAEGAGQMLGRVIESEAVESLAMAGGFASVMAVVELAMASQVLAAGAGGRLHLLMLAGVAALAVVLTAAWVRGRDRWTQVRMALTHDLVERMAGHRTRLAQEDPSRWHDGEDEAVARYHADSVGMDGLTAVLSTVLPRGWVLLGVLGLGPAFVAGASPVGIAVGLGGVLLGLGALSSLAGGLVGLGSAAIAWRQVAPLYRAAGEPVVRGQPGYALEAPGDDDRAEPVLEGHDLAFRYRPQGDPVIAAVSLTIRPGDRVLLEGPSGGGKSTLASLLVGLRPPASGLLLQRGLDRATLGDAGWRRRVTSAPQFHENYVLTETFAFNLLMGRGWPPSADDFAEAEAVCVELGLGPLLERMPAGLLQMVGETGWQLSHGERSRLFLARALLQRAELVVLDESFAALDPENLALALQATLRRAPALVVIAHP